MMSLTFDLFTQVSDSRPHDPLVWDCFGREKPRLVIEKNTVIEFLWGSQKYSPLTCFIASWPGKGSVQKLKKWGLKGVAGGGRGCNAKSVALSFRSWAWARYY